MTRTQVTGGSLVAVLMLAAGTTAARAQVIQAELRGTVVDASGAAVAGATVTAVQLETGTARETSTTSSGAYRMPALPVGTYRVSASLSGFKSQVKEGLHLGVGEVAVVGFELEVGNLDEILTVEASEPLINTQQSVLAGRIQTSQIETLPLNGRDWLGLVSLAPGARGNPGDIRSGVSGSDGAKYVMDGADVSNQCCLSTNTGYSLETIQEYRVLTSRFDAEYGRVGGLVIDAVTKSGTNEFHGSAFGFLRDDRFDAKNPFTGQVVPFKENQLGATLGGPLRRNRAHFFASYEHQDRDATAIPNTGFSQFDQPVDQGTSRHLASLRTDVQLNNQHRLYARVSTRREKQVNGNVGGRITQDAGVLRQNNGFDAVVGETWVASPRAVNQLRAYYVRRNQPQEPNNPTARLSFPSIALGAGLNDAQELSEHNLGVSDTFSYLATGWGGDHSLRAGFEFMRVRFFGATPTVSYGEFVFDRDPANPSDPRTYPAPTLYREDLGRFDYDIRNPFFGVFVQDDWRVSSKLTINLGLRYDVETGAVVDSRFANPFASLEPGDRKVDRNNVGPRLGFAYDPSGTGRFAIRGGVGRYFGRLLLDVLNIEATNADLRKVRASVTNPSLTNPLAGRTVEQFRAGLGAVDYFYVAHDLETEEQDQASLGFAAQIGSRIGIDVDYVHIDGRNVPMQRLINVFEDPATGLPRNPRQFGRPFPRYNAVFRNESTGYSRYDGLQVGFRARRAPKGLLELQASYTLSKTKDTYNSNRFGFLNNPFNLDDEYADSLNDQRHRFVVNGTAYLPWDLQLSSIFFFGSERPINVNTRRDPFGIGNYGFGNTRWLDASGATLSRNSERARRPDARLDVRLAKVFRARGVSVQAIAEVFNALNRANWNAATYGTTLGTATYLQPGFSSANFYQPRQVQFGLRVSY